MGVAPRPKTHPRGDCAVRRLNAQSPHAPITRHQAQLTSSPHPPLVFVFVVVAGAIGGPVAGALKSSGGFVPPNSDSQVATNMLQAASGAEPAPGIVLLVDTPQGASAASARVAAITHRLAALPGVVRTSGPAAVARDGRQVLVTGTLSASAKDNSVAKAAEAAFAPDHDVTVGGTAVANEQINSTVIKDLGFAELLAFPLLIALSILFFRGRAALMPLAVGVVTVLGTFLVLTGINHVYGLSVFALNLVIGMGLGLAVDYTLFIVTRFREELAGGAEVGRAVAVTMPRAGRTVLFSAATVACALATLTLFPQGFLKSMGIAGASVAVVAALSAVVVSPAMLGLWGRKLARRERASGEPDRWYRFARAVMRRPGTVAAVTAAVMVAATLPALSVVWSPASDSSVIPAGQSCADGGRRAHHRLRRRRAIAGDGGDPRARLGRRGGERLRPADRRADRREARHRTAVARRLDLAGERRRRGRSRR